MTELEAFVNNDLEPLEKSIVLDRKLLRNARRSYNELALITGLDPEEAAERLNALLDQSVIRDDLLHEKLLLFELGELIESTRERMDGATKDEDFGGMVRAAVSGIKLTLEQIDKRRKAIDGQLAKLSDEQAKQVAAVFSVAIELVIAELKKELPEQDEEVIRVTFERVLPDAIDKVEGLSA